MADTELLIPMAEIAGVFVGFGALIALRSGGPTDPREVAGMRWVVSFGMATVMVGLTPAIVGRFDLTEHAVWALSSAVALVGGVAVVAATARSPEYRQSMRAELADQRAAGRPRWVTAVEWAPTLLLGVLLWVIPIIIIVGVVPDLEAALYNAYAALLLLGAGWTLLALVFAQRRPATA